MAGSPESIDVNTTLLAGGAVLAGVGSALVATGLLLSGIAVASAVRQWYRRYGRSPRRAAQVRLNQVKAAGTAGFEAWRQGAAGAPTPA
ncbi:MAG: hypothetical protein ACHQNA_05950 [Acidimicrobiales bacterium]